MNMGEPAECSTGGEGGSGTGEADATEDAEPVLSVEGLETHYPIREGWLRRQVGRVRAVDGVSFAMRPGEALGLVGESGCGKSTLARTIIGLEASTGGEISFHGQPVATLGGTDLQSFRRRVQLIVQDPNDAFSPRMRIGEAVAEPLRLHGMDDSARRRDLVIDLLERVGLSAADADRYPHEFSGGEKQRIAIARALIVNPDLIIADEPTSALDSRVQSDVLGLLDEIRREYEIAVLFISHDIDVVRLFCDRLAVMYLGKLVEKGAAGDIREEPMHPYTRVLMGSIPSLDPSDRVLARPLTETVPDPADPPGGCRFHTRCPEIIPPDDVDLPRDVWRSVAEFRFTLSAGELPDALRTADDAAASVRAHFGLPEPIPNGPVEAAVEEAIDAIERGELERAAERLAETVTTVCERDRPEAVERANRLTACHRYDPSIGADPQPWSPE